MIKSNYKVIGVMSGTSLDGIDLVYVSFDFYDKWSFQIINAETTAYTSEWRGILKDLVLKTKAELIKIDTSYTGYLATIIKAFIQKHNITDFDFISSHGHTAWHQPQNKLTYQIGNLPHLASLLNKAVVCDFRVQDVELGGQGAPLVPIGDTLLFSEFNFCLNLGGFANISTNHKNIRIAYDICPVNIVLNHFVKQLGFDFDDKGNIAATGKINKELLDKLNDLNFYKKPYPKSLGLEWVKSEMIPLIMSFNIKVKDVLRTFVEHVAMQISKELKMKQNASVLITGGGAYNAYLISRIKFYNNQNIVLPTDDIIEFKEALIFGFLGVLKIRGENNCLHSVTGASRSHSSGKIFLK